MQEEDKIRPQQTLKIKCQKNKSDKHTKNKWKEVDVQGIEFIGRRMAKQDVITFSAQLVDEIKKEELPENPEEKHGTWKTVQEMTRNGTYTGQLSAIVNEKYENKQWR